MEDHMDEDVNVDGPVKPRDPNDLSAYKLDEYDEEGAGTGMFA
jgi:hypothetical protein